MERRRATRRGPTPEEPISRLRLRTGREVAVIDVSNAGALVEGHVRLLPGTHVDIHIITRDGRLLIRSRVTRCYVSALHSDQVCYRGALSFDRIVDTTVSGYPVPEEARSTTRIAGALYPTSIDAHSPRVEQPLSA